MLKLDNENAELYSMGRCGTKSISHHILGYSYSDIFNDVTNQNRFMFFVSPENIIENNKTQILVLRNPIERFMSGHQLWIEQSHLDHPQYDSYEKFMIYHGAPFLHRLDTSINFKILRFEKLADYVPHINRDPALTDRKFTDSLYDWNQEEALYRGLIESKEELSPEEFHRCFS